jgi:peptidyl-prolyl cis-trans isomerase D
MAVLGKIRQKSALLMLIIGLSLFAFIAQDFWRKDLFSSNSKDVGAVNGEGIDFQKFNEKVNNLEKSGRGISNMQAVNQVWDQEVNIALLTAEFKKLGIRAGKSHLIDALKQNQNIGQEKMFQNEAGVFDVAKYNEYFKTNPEQQQYKDATEADAILNSKYQIYASLIKSGFNTTKLEAKLKYEAEANKVSFDFVSVPYNTIKDTEVKITNEELTAYMETKKEKYKADESREIQYVLIEDKPSVADENEIKGNITALLSGRVEYNDKIGKNDTLQGFKNTSNVADFVNSNSDKSFDSTYVVQKDLPATDAVQLMNLPAGEVYGPYIRQYENGKFYCLSKSLGKKANVNARASHILIGWEGSGSQNQKEKRTKEQAKVKADLILAQCLANPSAFMMAAFQNSEDSSAQQGGDLGYFSQGQMVKPFNDFVFNNAKGKIGMVESQFGYHIINITDKQDGVKLATVAKKIMASEKTQDELYAKSSNFELKAGDKSFEDAAKEMKLTILPNVKFKALEEGVGALGAQRQIVRWAFNTDTNINDVKKFEVTNMGNVIAKLVKINPEGLLSMEDARIQVEPILRNKKKAEMIAAKMKGNSLEAIAAANKVAVQQAVDLTIENPNLPNAGVEYKVVGIAFGTMTNKTSKTIEGNGGVFVVRTKAITKALPTNDYSAYLMKLKQQNAGKAGAFSEALKKVADITDNRGSFNF